MESGCFAGYACSFATNIAQTDKVTMTKAAKALPIK